MILVTGATGQLGFQVVQELNNRNIPCVGVGSAELDITNEKNVMNYIQKLNPIAIIHCAAYTAVDQAEDEAELCRKVNGDGTKYIASACKTVHAKMIYISTDYVFSGEGTHFHEVDEPTVPLGVYGKSKLDGEKAVQEILNRFFIVRISWVFGKKGNNFVKTMLRLGEVREELSVVNDQIGSPTYTPDLSTLLCDMVATEKYGIYHATNEGTCSWAEFAKELMKQGKLSCKIKGIPSVEYPCKAKRPNNSRLSKKALMEEGFSSLPPWEESVVAFLKEIQYEKSENELG